MNLTAFALNNARLTILATVLLALAGVAAFLTFPSKEDPEVTVREALVVAAFPGMSANRVEDLITRKLEKEIRRIPEVKKIKASSKSGLSIIHVVVYDRFFDLDPIWQDLRNKMRDVGGQLPVGTIGPDVNTDFGDVFIATVAITADGFDMAEMHDVAKQLRDEFYTVQGVERVELHGVQEQRIFLETSNARLAEFGLTPDSLIETLNRQNIILPGGKVDVGGPEIIIEPSGNLESIRDIEELIIGIPNTDDVAYLRDVLTVKRGFVDPPERLAYFDGKPAIVMAISMQDGQNILALGPRLQEQAADMEVRLPYGYELNFATYQADYVRASVNGVSNNVYQTLAIVLGMVMLFLGWRTGLIVGAIVPLTMLVTLVAMRLLGIELERVSLATLIIALGLLVDNGVVIAEDIQRRLSEGESRRDAALACGKQLAAPLLASSLTTVLAFMPLMLASNSAGEYLRSMSLVILITLLTSWVLAMMVTPLLSMWFMPEPKRTPEEAEAVFDKPLFRAYTALLGFVLRLRYAYVAVMAALLVGGFTVLGTVPEQFFPESSRNQFMVYVDMPAGYGTKSTDQTTRALLGWLNDAETNPEVISHVSYVGYGGPRFFVPLSPRDDDTNVSFTLVTVEDADQVDAVLARTNRYLAETQPAAKARLKKFFLGNSETGLMEVRISGPDKEVLARLGEQVEAGLRAIPGTINIHNNWENRIAKVVVKVDQARARRAGITSADVAASLNTFFSGGQVSSYRERDTVIPLVLRAEDSERTNLDRVRDINIYSTGRQTNVPLSQIANFDVVNEFSRIERRNLQRTIAIEAKHSWLTAEELQSALMPAMQQIEAELPLGYSWVFGGETEDAAEANAALVEFLPHAIMAMVLLLVWQFNSFLKPAIIFITIPLAFIGAAIGLKLGGGFLGFMAILGFLSLGGIIINNAIVLLDQIKVELDAGADGYQALINASVARFQPVMLTTLTTILGLLPLMLPPDPLFFDMAMAIAAGLSLGTLLTLLTVPVLYAILFRVQVPGLAERPQKMPVGVAAATG